MNLIQEFPVEQLAGAIGATWHGAPDVRVSAVIHDSRAVTSGCLFVAIVGERFDGHAFAEGAIEAGAHAALVSALPENAGPWLEVEDTLAALQRLGRWVWDQAHARGVKTIALTGSNGKTTTKELLRALWQTYGATYATHGNYNNHIGVPLTLGNMPAELDTLIVEMGANAPGDIGQLIRLAPGDVRIITSIGHAHIEGFGGLDGVRRTKREIFDGAGPETLALVPHHERDALILERFPGRVWTFGPEAEADVRFELVAQGDVEAGTCVEVTRGDERLRVYSPLHGVHNASNLAIAVATLLDGDEPRNEMVLTASLEALHLPQGRWRHVERAGHTFLDDAYNANPSSVLASFEAFMSWQRGLGTGRPSVAVIGEMLELGEDAKNWHASVARSIAKEEDLTTFIAVGLYAQQMADAARGVRAEGLEVVAAASVEEAARALDARAPSMVFLKASRGARLERVIDLVQDGRADPT